ncbi:MAG: hypothetical protein KY476_12170 [Planctomycetes bacterium]|nr:hypothetical protein [Planctomycetota bacterium]
MASHGVEIPPQDPRLIERLVGFLEYGMALKNLTEFVNSAGETELVIAEEIVRSRPQFRVDPDLARYMRFTGGPNDRRRTAAGTTSQHGLAWVMALARVEFGAMLAGYSSHPSPFQATPPTPLETEAFRALLNDAVAAHYWALKFDPAVRNYPQTGVPDAHIITYGRRVGMIRRMLEAARAFSLTRLAPLQLAQLSAWDNEFRRFQLVLLYCLSQKIGTEGTTSVEYSMNLANCPPIEHALRCELGREIGDGRIRGGQISQFRVRLSDILTSIDPTLLAVPCQHQTFTGPQAGSVPVSARRRP